MGALHPKNGKNGKYNKYRSNLFTSFLWLLWFITFWDNFGGKTNRLLKININRSLSSILKITTAANLICWVARGGGIEVDKYRLRLNIFLKVYNKSHVKVPEGRNLIFFFWIVWLYSFGCLDLAGTQNMHFLLKALIIHVSNHENNRNKIHNRKRLFFIKALSHGAVIPSMKS